MIYLLWALINIGLFIFLLFICFRATKLIREKLGLFATLVFVVGLLSFMGHSGNDVSNIKTWTFTSNDSLSKFPSTYEKIKLEKTWISTYELNVQFRAKQQGGDSLPISAYSIQDGFISGTVWKPITIQVVKAKEENGFTYLVSGVVEWKLLGITLYSQLKEYNGILPMR